MLDHLNCAQQKTGLEMNNMTFDFSNYGSQKDQSKQKCSKKTMYDPSNFVPQGAGLES